MYTIRRVTLDDLDVYRATRLRALADSPSAFGSTYDDESKRADEEWTQRLTLAASSSERVTFLAFAGDECVGLAGGLVDDFGADRQLVSMWVAPQHRGTGVAAQLVDAVLDWTRRHDGRTIGLWVTRGNDRAQRFYERCGFALTGESQPLPSDPDKDELRMLREL